MSALARGRVTARGCQPDEMLHDLYRQAHIVAAPSRYESFGLVYQEAIAFGRPVVASAEDPSASEFVGATGAGILAERTRPEDVAMSLRSLIQSPHLRDQLHHRAVIAAGRFDRPYLGRETLELYKEAIARSRKARR